VLVSAKAVPAFRVGKELHDRLNLHGRVIVRTGRP
jgi:hypothetical protein